MTFPTFRGFVPKNVKRSWNIAFSL